MGFTRSTTSTVKMSGVIMTGSLLKRALREPLTHFIIAGAALFALSQALAGPSEQSRIEITRALMQRLATTFEQQYGVSPNPEELAWLRRNWIRQEIYYREALALGLDQDDEIVRRRLAQKVEFIEEDRVVQEEPTQRELEAFFSAHQSRYLPPERRSFRHIYFSPDRDGAAGAQQRARQALAELRAGARPPRGDVFSGPMTFVEADGAELVRVFGENGFARAVFDSPLHVWSGPFQSGLGWHLVSVDSEAPAESPPFRAVEDRVRQDYLHERREQANLASFEALRERYVIIDRTGTP